MKKTAVWVAVLLLWLTPLAFAQASWTAELGMGTALTPGAWAPLWIFAPDSEPWTLEIRSLSASGRETARVKTAYLTGGTHEQPVYLAAGTQALSLRFLSQGLLRQEMTLSLAGRDFPGHLIGVSGLPASVQYALAQVLLPVEPVRVVSIPPSRWPSSPLSFGGVSALVLKDPGPVLAPAQLRALQAWIASGGRLVIVEELPASRSLLSQVGTVEGWGRVRGAKAMPASDSWREALALAPYEQTNRLGSDFEPRAANLPPVGRPDPPAAVTFLVIWAALGILILVLRRKAGPGGLLVWASVCSLAAGGLWASGSLAWDRGSTVHGREVVLPGDLGRFTSLEASQSPTVPWALDLWKADLPPGDLRIAGPDRIVVDAFLPALARSAQYQVRWEPQGLRWLARKEAPAALQPDLAWLTKTTASLPGTTWSVGLEGPVCWVRPELAP